MRIPPILRGIVATALTWAVVWVPFALIPFGFATLAGAHLPLRMFLALVAGQAITGALSGATFAGLLAIAGRRRTFESLRLPWIAGLGAVGGIVFPFAVRATLLTTMDVAVPVSALLSGLATSALLGAGCASLTLSIARRAPALPPAPRRGAPAVGTGTA